MESKNHIPESQASKACTDVIDVAVIGAGPAGMTAALYVERAGFDAVMFERIAPGGQLATTEHVENYPGFPDGTSGFDLAFAMKQQADNFGAKTINEEVVAVDVTSTPKRIDTAFGSYEASCIIVATGARPRKLGVPLEDELAGKGVSYCATCDGNFFRGKTVAVVGGGNTAVADAIFLARLCEKVYLVHRRDRLRATAVYNKRLEGIDNVEILWNTQVRRLFADSGKLAGIEVENTAEHSTQKLPCEGVFVAVGNEPNVEFLQGALELEGGYVKADETGKTSAAGVFAAGDVRTKALRQITTAVADGSVAAESAAEFLTL